MKASTISKNQIAKEWNSNEITLAARAAQRHVPLGGTFELTPRCNLNCKMCYVRLDPLTMKEIGREKNAKEWIALAREAAEAGTLNLLITGGEPLLREDFAEIYTAICQMGFIITLNTNATLMNSEYAELFKKYPPTAVVELSTTSIYSYNGSIVQIYNNKYDIPSCLVATNNYTEWELYLSPDFFQPKDEDLIMAIKDGILAGLRDVIIIVLSQKKGLLLHSCSILWEEQVIAFSGKSGVGKSTHAKLWQKSYGVSILDGDVTACRILEDGPIAYGLPWCGTSGQFINKCGTLRAVVFLQQAKYNRIRKLDFMEAYMYLTGRCFLLPWNDDLTNSFLEIIEELTKSTEFYLLECRPDYEAVEMVKKCLNLS